MTQRHDRSRNTPRVGEPVQVYLQRPERDRLERLAERLGATKSDVLRRGLEALEAQTAAAVAGATVARGRIALPTFAGGALLPGVDLDDNAALLDLMGE